MAVLWAREIAKERTLSGKYQDNYAYTRGFLVRTDSQAEPLSDISNAPGVAYMDEHPDDSSVVMLEFDVKPAEESGLLYVVSFKYGPAPFDSSEGGGEEDPQYVAGLMKQAVWTASSSVTTGPVDKDINGNAIVNSAGDPLEDVTSELAEFKLQVTLYALNHATWMQYAREYTNAINDATWNGGAAGEWKCQGCSARLNAETHLGAAINVWELTWDFAYREGGWDPLLLDIGFNQRVDNDGTPSAAGTKRASAKGADSKGSKQPIGLSNGVFVPAGTPPDLLTFELYKRKSFSIFGEVYTP